MSVTSDLLRGNTDTIILSALEKEDSYGYQINKRVARATGDAYVFKEATLYSAFKRLEDSGCIQSYWGEESPGARRRYYHLTDKGRRVLRELRNDWQKCKNVIDQLTGGKL